LLAGPGRYSLDRALGIRLPRWIALLGLVAIAITVAFAAQKEPPTQEESAEQSREELQAEEEDQQQT
jgi:putative oxidoreductase